MPCKKCVFSMLFASESLVHIDFLNEVLWRTIVVLGQGWRTSGPRAHLNREGIPCGLWRSRGKLVVLNFFNQLPSNESWLTSSWPDLGSVVCRGLIFQWRKPKKQKSEHWSRKACTNWSVPVKALNSLVISLISVISLKAVAADDSNNMPYSCAARVEPLLTKWPTIASK